MIGGEGACCALSGPRSIIQNRRIDTGKNW
jgi:hypothetical protein